MPAKTVTHEKRYVYLLLTVLREQRDGTEGAVYVPEYEPITGDLRLEVKNHGSGTHTFQYDDGPYIYTLTGCYVATGEVGSSGELRFDFGAMRVFQLLELGMNSEIIMRQQIHEVVDGLKELIEPELAKPNPEAGDLAAAFDLYEKNLWRKH